MAITDVQESNDSKSLVAIMPNVTRQSPQKLRAPARAQVSFWLGRAKFSPCTTIAFIFIMPTPWLVRNVSPKYLLSLTDLKKRNEAGAQFRVFLPHLTTVCMGLHQP